MHRLTPGASLPPSSQHMIGPFFPRTFVQPGDNDLTIATHGASPTQRGETILLRGRVTCAEGLPCLNQILEVWQADAAAPGRMKTVNTNSAR